MKKRYGFVSAGFLAMAATVWAQAPTFTPGNASPDPVGAPTLKGPSLDDPKNFVVVQIHVDETLQPKNLLNVNKECQTSAPCQAALSAISDYFDIPVDKVSAGIARFAPGPHDSETWTGDFHLPDGYQYCTSSMRLTSIVPHDGPKGSMFKGSILMDGIHLETWTPVQGLGGGRSWVEGDVYVVGVRPIIQAINVINGKCQRDQPGRGIWLCRGGGCETPPKGAPIGDTGAFVNLSTPPPASSRN